MTTARDSGPSWSMRESTRSGVAASHSRPRSASSSVVMTQPSSLPGPVRAMTCRTPGHLRAHVLELGDLLGVLGEDDAAAGVGEDVGDVLGDRRRVDGRRRTSGADDGEVGEDPLDAGRRRDGDAVLQRHPEADEPGSPLLHDLVRLPPRQGGELARPLREVEVGRRVGRRPDPAAEERTHAGSASVEDVLVDVPVGEGLEGHVDSFVTAVARHRRLRATAMPG